MKYFRNLKANVVEAVGNPEVASMMERYPDTYEPCDEKGKSLDAPKTSGKPKAGKPEVAGAKEQSDAPKTSDK